LRPATEYGLEGADDVDVVLGDIAHHLDRRLQDLAHVFLH